MDSSVLSELPQQDSASENKALKVENEWGGAAIALPGPLSSDQGLLGRVLINRPRPRRTEKYPLQHVEVTADRGDMVGFYIISKRNGGGAAHGSKKRIFGQTPPINDR